MSGIFQKLQASAQDHMSGRQNRMNDMTGFVDPDSVRASMMEGMGGYQDQFGTMADQYGTRASNMFNQAGQMMAGRGPILDAMRGQLQGQISDLGAQANMNMARQLASRGLGVGGLRSALASSNVAQLGEQTHQGLLGIQKYGLEAGQGMSQIGSDLMAGQGQAIGAGAQMQSQGNQALVSQMQANAANKAQFLQAEAARKRAEAKRRSSGFGGLAGGLLGGTAGFFLGGPAGAMAGFSMGSSVGAGLG